MESTPPLPPAPGQRSLAAIVFTDVVSFSARMQADEVTTLRLLQRDFGEMKEICTAHHGSVLKSTGDGLLLYFSSAVQAVACALAIQRSFAGQAKLRAASENLVHRVGIHLGDVFMNEQDVMGDGVNIAARLQAEAEPGGICISQTVYDVVRNKLALQVTRLGPRELKNISQAIPIYKLLLEAQIIESTEGTEPDEEEGEPPPGAEDRPAAAAPKRGLSGSQKIMAGAAVVLVAVLAALGWGLWRQQKAALAEAEASRAALTALMAQEDDTVDTGLPAHRIAATLADWRAELREKRSRALQEYNFEELAQSLRDPRSPVAGKPEARVRAQVLQRIRALNEWVIPALQKYSRDKPLIVHQLTGTAPKEIKVYMGPDQVLYTTEGGAVRNQRMKDLEPADLAAIVAAAMKAAKPVPPREAVMGALAFGSLYNLPELGEALRQERPQRKKR
ncbi:MAG TPA: adenylate/guanylate cyclase domain-containing protein [Lacunisphaera sp.]|nr:adenylate/guanylate cyclase domain-containing protein [Lacunisphaera sp.]